jgi:hypothetical protein
MLRGLLILFLLTHYFPVRSQDFTFYKENITMKIENNSFYVTGIYYVRNQPGKIRLLTYPYPSGPALGDIDSVFIYNLTTNEPITPLKSDNTSTVFKIEFGSGNELAIQISYRQKLFGNHAEYILKSTRHWKKPLKIADYQLIVPAEINVFSFSIPPQDSVVSQKSKVYYWTKQNYYPDKNMVFEFRK